MRKKSSLDTKEWQLLLVLEELQYQLTKKEKNTKLIVWLNQKIEDLRARSGW